MNFRQQTTQLILFLFLLFSIFHCKEKDWREEIEKQEQEYLKEVRKTHEFLLLNRKTSYKIANSQPTLKDAIIQFLKDAPKYKDPNEIPSLMNEDELKEILYPHVLGTGTALDSNPFPRYEEMIRDRRKLALIRINENTNKIKWDNIKFSVSELRNYGPLVGHKIDKINLINNNGNAIKLENIKMVIEHQGQFKVAVIGP